MGKCIISILRFLFISKKTVALSLTFLICSFSTYTQNLYRTEIKIPDIRGYKTLKCDLHIHTAYSDGEVWPSLRVKEAWCEGLDVIAITDHFETNHRGNRNDLGNDMNRAHEIAFNLANELDIILIRGTEITRAMPPGHFNCIFLKDVNALHNLDIKSTLLEAKEQGAFIFWNHPGWNQKNEIPVWYDIHTELYDAGLMDGVEIVNHGSYYPLAYEWANEKELTLFGNSDLHLSSNLYYNLTNTKRRPITLVFAENRTEAAIRDALKAKRTVVFYENKLMGNEVFLKEIFNESIEIINKEIRIPGTWYATVFIKNNSDISFDLETNQEFENIKVPGKIQLIAGKTSQVSVFGKSDEGSEKEDVVIKYKVTNLLTGSDSALSIELKISSEVISLDEY